VGCYRYRTAEVALLRDELVTEEEVTDALREFDPVWQQLSPKEQARVLEPLIERVNYDGEEGQVSVTFRPTGFRELAEEFVLEQAAA
jgi:site-specific DNA recombinase